MPTHIVHLVRDELEPVLTRLDARNHARQPVADDRLRMQRPPERGALSGPLEALLDRAPLRSEARADDHPALVVEVAEHDLHPAPDLAERVCDRGPSTVEGHVGRACGGGVGGFDGLGGYGVLSRYEHDDVSLGRLTRDGKVVGKGSVRDPPGWARVSYKKNMGMAEWGRRRLTF